ncbi:SOS response-associated peptidase [Flavobacterium sp. TMP13]|uniref:SOS response-associated peptidase n=1 Tax=Flavobacterium sp. TMP13 TaxID=3425950 RepID=UPI003D76DED5
MVKDKFSCELIPIWAKDEEFTKNTLNAHIETLNEKATFKNILDHRCLIVATSYYEWRHYEDKTKQKFRISSQGEEIFSFAGLYSNWLNKETAEEKLTFTMITTETNETMRHVHNIKKRIPVMLKKEDVNKWLSGSPQISQFAFPYEAPLIAFPTT